MKLNIESAKSNGFMHVFGSLKLQH